MRNTLKALLLVACAVLPALGCGEKVVKVDPVTADQQIKQQQEMVRQERAN